MNKFLEWFTNIDEDVFINLLVLSAAFFIFCGGIALLSFAFGWTN